MTPSDALKVLGAEPERFKTPFLERAVRATSQYYEYRAMAALILAQRAALKVAVEAMDGLLAYNDEEFSKAVAERALVEMAEALEAKP